MRIKKEMTEAEAKAEGFDILPAIDSETTEVQKERFNILPPLSDEMTQVEAEAEGYNILPTHEDEVELTDEENYIQATKVKLPTIDTETRSKLPQLTDEDLKYLNEDISLTVDDLSGLEDSSFKLPKPPML